MVICVEDSAETAGSASADAPPQVMTAGYAIGARAEGPQSESPRYPPPVRAVTRPDS